MLDIQLIVQVFVNMSDNRDSSSTATTEPDADAQLEQEVKEEEEEAALNAIKNASEDEKKLVVKAGSSARERRGKA
jgi:hypothetical protein